MEIRKAAKKDVLQLSELLRQEIEYQQHLACDYELMSNFDWIAYTEKKLKGLNRLILVAELGGNMAGFIDVRIIDYAPNNGYKSIFQMIRRFSRKRISLPIKPMRRGFIEDCYVIPSFRKKGIGSQLVISAMKWFQSKQISRIQLSLVAGNKEGEAFWRKSGFDTFRLTLSRDI